MEGHGDERGLLDGNASVWTSREVRGRFSILTSSHPKP